MTKNMTRKGLAFGAMLGLAVSSLAALPAQATVTSDIDTGLTSGTSFNSVVGYANELSLSTVLAPGLSGNESTLTYRVENPSGANLEIKAGTTNVTVAQTVTSTTTNKPEVWAIGGAALSAVDSDSVAANMQTALTSFNIVVPGTIGGDATYDNLLTIGVGDGDVDVSVTVYAWLDSSSDAANVQSATELQGNTVTLNFYDQANVSATTTMVAPVTGAASVSAVTVTTPELNGQQLGADFIDVSMTAQGNGNAVLAKNTSSDAATMGTTTYSGVTKSWTTTAYTKYSKATDAWNGTNGTLDGIAALTDNNGAVAGSTPVQLAVASNVATFTVFPHGLGASNSGTFAAKIAGLTTATNTSALAGIANLTIVDANQFTMALTATDQGAEVAGAGSATLWSVATNATVQAAGIYSARPYIGATALGTAGSSTNSATTADDTKAVIAVSDNVAAGYNADATADTNKGDTVEIRTGTTTVSATATIYYTDALDFNRVKVVGAGVPVTGAISSPTGTFQINSSGAGVTSDVELTDANGQVTFTVTTTTAASASNAVTLSISPQSTAAQNAASSRFTLVWDAAAYELFDLNAGVSQPGSNASSYRSINASGSYTYGFALLDQWGKAAPDATWRLNVVNQGRTVSSDTHSLSNGRVNVVVADSAQGSGSTITSTVNVQKLVSGTWTTQATESWDGTGFGTVVINALAAQTDSIVLDADGAQLYGSTNADLSSPIAAADVAAQDRRTSKLNQPGYTDDVRINGQVRNSLTGIARSGAAVTISGDSSILFSNGLVDSFGSITVVADNSGNFTVQAFANKAATDTVVTITTANGATKTQKVTFEKVAARSGTTLTITGTGNEPGKTMIFTGLLTDDYGNPVDTTNGGGSSATLTVTYSGPGLVSVALPTTTGVDGTFTVRVLLGSNDTGTATVAATYGAANGTISAADTGDDIDIKAALSTVVSSNTGNVGALASWTKNLNDGTVKMYAKNIVGAGKVQFMLNGKEIAWVNASSAADSKLRTANGASYLVRTVDLVEGQKNVLEVYVDGVRTTRTAYTY